MKPEEVEENQEEGNILVWLTGFGLLAAMVAIFIYVPTEKTEGVIQRIMYFHVPCAWLSFLLSLWFLFARFCFCGRRTGSGIFMLMPQQESEWFSVPWF